MCTRVAAQARRLQNTAEPTLVYADVHIREFIQTWLMHATQINLPTLQRRKCSHPRTEEIQWLESKTSATPGMLGEEEEIATGTERAALHAQMSK